jgi:hypothetical protein
MPPYRRYQTGLAPDHRRRQLTRDINTGMVVQMSAKLTGNKRHARPMAGLTALAAVALAAVAVTGCNSNSNSPTTGGSPVFSNTANPFAGSGSPGDGSPGDGSPGDGSPGDGSPGDGSPPPAPPSTPAPQANPNYPYEPGGVTFSGGAAGGQDLFSIPAGAYSLNQQASYDAATDADGSGTCLFGGELDYQSGSGGNIPLGNNAVPIGSEDPIEGPATKINLPAGDYRIYIYPETTCSWTVELWP